jgi:hypothetical protein
MVKDINTDNYPCTLMVSIETTEPTKIWIKVCDAKATKTFYSKRYSKVDGEQDFYIGMPQSPYKARLVVYKDGESPLDNNGYEVIGVDILPLQSTKFLPIGRKTSSFIKFAQEFSQEASYIDASKTGIPYYSDNGKFRIDYFDVVRSRKNGKPLSTPARISQLNGKIEVSKKDFFRYSIPMRMAILLHEYCHFYVNKNPSSEVESDLNALKIYLSMGYPRIDAYNVFLNVFKTAGSKEALHRFEKLDAFIKNWSYKND